MVAILRSLVAAWRRATPGELGRATSRRCGPALIGAVVATVVGTLANDSGALLLEIGAAYLLVFARLGLGRGR